MATRSYHWTDHTVRLTAGNAIVPYCDGLITDGTICGPCSVVVTADQGGVDLIVGPVAQPEIVPLANGASEPIVLDVGCFLRVREFGAAGSLYPSVSVRIQRAPAPATGYSIVRSGKVTISYTLGSGAVEVLRVLGPNERVFVSLRVPLVFLGWPSIGGLQPGAFRSAYWVSQVRPPTVSTSKLITSSLASWTRRQMKSTHNSIPERSTSPGIDFTESLLLVRHESVGIFVRGCCQSQCPRVSDRILHSLEPASPG